MTRLAKLYELVTPILKYDYREKKICAFVPSYAQAQQKVANCGLDHFRPFLSRITAF